MKLTPENPIRTGPRKIRYWCGGEDEVHFSVFANDRDTVRKNLAVLADAHRVECTICKLEARKNAWKEEDEMRRIDF